jgi:hypothetical protein
VTKVFKNLKVLDGCMTAGLSPKGDNHKFDFVQTSKGTAKTVTMCSLKTEYRDQNLKYNVKTSEVAKPICKNQFWLLKQQAIKKAVNIFIIPELTTLCK